MVRFLKTFRGPIIGVAAGVVMRSAATLFGGNLSRGLNELLFYGGTAVIAGFLLWMAWDWVKHSLPIPKWLPEPARKFLAWEIYQPIISDPISVEVAGHIMDTGRHQCWIMFVIPVEAIFPYGRTTLDFSASALIVKQGRREFRFEVEPVIGHGATMAESFSKPKTDRFMPSYRLEQAPDGAGRFDVSGEFRWAIAGAFAELGFWGVTSVAGTLPKLRGTKRGARHL